MPKPAPINPWNLLRQFSRTFNDSLIEAVNGVRTIAHGNTNGESHVTPYGVTLRTLEPYIGRMLRVKIVGPKLDGSNNPVVGKYQGIILPGQITPSKTPTSQLNELNLFNLGQLPAALNCEVWHLGETYTASQNYGGGSPTWTENYPHTDISPPLVYFAHYYAVFETVSVITISSTPYTLPVLVVPPTSADVTVKFGTATTNAGEYNGNIMVGQATGAPPAGLTVGQTCLIENSLDTSLSGVWPVTSGTYAEGYIIGQKLVSGAYKPIVYVTYPAWEDCT